MSARLTISVAAFYLTLQLVALYLVATRIFSGVAVWP